MQVDREKIVNLHLALMNEGFYQMSLGYFLISTEVGEDEIDGFLAALDGALHTLGLRRVSDRRLEGRVAVVTGGGSGIGEAICVRLADDGARVAVLDVAREAAELTATLVGGTAVAADVADAARSTTRSPRSSAALGPVDVWVNNAGIAAVAHAARIADRAAQQQDEAATGAVTTPLESLVRLPDDEWRRMLAVHLDGTFHGTRAAARSMAARGRERSSTSPRSAASRDASATRTTRPRRRECSALRAPSRRS